MQAVPALSLRDVATSRIRYWLASVRSTASVGLVASRPSRFVAMAEEAGLVPAVGLDRHRREVGQCVLSW